jgi:organic hydroperoxide reductase OsmC/OhrA
MPPERSEETTMSALHSYTVTVEWTGAGATWTSGYTAYSRDHVVRIGDKPVIQCSSDPSFRGDPTRINPEELFVSSLAQCHMLWFLHMASRASVVVVAYRDHAQGTMRVDSASGKGRFVDVTLSPHVTVTGAPVNEELLARLHRDAHDRCFISQSVNFPVVVEPVPAGHLPRVG